MNHLSRTLAIVAAISLAAPVWAQTEAAPAEEQAPVASGVSVSERPAQGDAEPDGYLSSEHGSWQVRCMHATDGSDPCQMYQLVKDADGNSVADMLVLLPAEGEDVAAFIQISAPLASLLPAGIAVSVDGAGQARFGTAGEAELDGRGSIHTGRRGLPALRRPSCRRPPRRGDAPP